MPIAVPASIELATFMLGVEVSARAWLATDWSCFTSVVIEVMPLLAA